MAWNVAAIVPGCSGGGDRWGHPASPRPAPCGVCGAVAFVLQRRGGSWTRFAAPNGWVTADGTQFAVAVLGRCAVRIVPNDVRPNAPAAATTAATAAAAAAAAFGVVFV